MIRMNWPMASDLKMLSAIGIIPLIYIRGFGLVYWGLTPQQQPGSYQGGEMMMMKSVFWWRKPEYPEETTDLRQVTDETFHNEGVRGYCRLKSIIWQ